jgi:hypothetical protein
MVVDIKQSLECLHQARLFLMFGISSEVPSTTREKSTSITICHGILPLPWMLEFKRI